MAEEIAIAFAFFAAFFLVAVIGILVFVFWIWMIVDVAKRKMPNEAEKVMWIILLIFVGVIGAIIYYFLVKKPDNSGVFK